MGTAPLHGLADFGQYIVARANFTRAMKHGGSRRICGPYLLDRLRVDHLRLCIDNRRACGVIVNQPIQARGGRRTKSGSQLRLRAARAEKTLMHRAEAPARKQKAFSLT
jgi:hypothetical protein